MNNKLLYLIGTEERPIHKAYQYLSGTHQSDYARAYLMYYFGGGYTDTKHTHIDWNPYFKQL
uniref:Predicted protein n=1 Tax=Hordeum vulgare subsp. vulgare TaxID=112509 RepID=F2DE29_HORVV|nr:predicted protein [Hordeum vulgare subsp. vulgare]